MIWGDERLTKLIDNGYITHADPKCVNPASINIRLGNTFLIPKSKEKIKLGDEIEYRRRRVRDGKGIYIKSGEFLLATTKEYIHVPGNVAVFVQGRSSIGRAALSVQNAGFVDPGFYGHLTLELKNDGPYDILLTPGYPVAQLVYMDAKDVKTLYRGKYLGQIEATGSRMQLDHFEWRKSDD